MVSATDIQQNFNESVFASIPQRKINDAVEDIKNIHLDHRTGILTQNGSILIDAIHRYAKTNIPVDYWYRDMNNFDGSKILKDKYQLYASNIQQAYKKGYSVCFAGGHGRGKTFISSCILKRVVETNQYTGLYVNLVDVINVIVSSNYDVKQKARIELSNVDFLVIDEFDSRFMGTDNAADLFGRTLEPVIRHRIQNCLPTILCTNSPEPVNSFSGALKQSFSSLMNKIDLVPVLGSDHRVKKSKRNAK